ncbi:membrane protein insertion efficiency factor YidD [candidate division KSB1 bacterium]
MKIVVFIILILISLNLFAQDIKTDWQPWSDKKDEKEKIKEELPKTFYKPSDIIILSLNFYKKTISRQDGDVCNFIPTCSEFASKALKEKGFIIGTLLAADRLTRCHPFAYGKYKIKGNKLSDRVIDYEF